MHAKKSTGRFKLFACLLLMAFCPAWIVQAQDNLFRLRANTHLQFSAASSLIVGPGTSIEWSFRPMADFNPNRESDYQCLFHFGETERLAFAVLFTSDVRTGQAKLGLISTLANPPTRDNFISLKTIDGAGQPTELIAERGATYQITFVFAERDNVVDVYLDGHPQGSLTCAVPPDLRSNLALKAGGKFEKPGSFPFDGELGGFRVWNRALPEASVIALNKFGRGCDPTDLTMLLEYGHLAAFGDFRGSIPAECRLVFPNARLGGVWRENLASVGTNVDGKGTFHDFPVYTFLPTDSGDFQVFEDFNYIGLFASSPSNSIAWRFQHVDPGWPAIDFTLREILKAGRPTTQIVCPRLPVIPRPFAGKSSGEVTLVRGTLDESGEGINAQRFFSKAESDRNKVTGDMTAVFLLGNNIRYKDVLYRGYNIARMDKFNLFENGTSRRDNYVFMQPDHGLFEINVDQIRIIPKGLSINNINMGVSSAETYYASNAMEYSQVATSRLGAGVSGSLSFGTGSASPYMVQGTINLNVVLQSETTNELQNMETNNQDKMISISSYRHYDLLHRKDMERIDPEFRAALEQLYETCKGQDSSSRETQIFEFFENWGTHFVFGGTFGAIKWTERTIDERTVQSINRQSWNQFISINEGQTGSEGTLSRSLTETLKNTSETTISLGGNTAGDANTPAGPADEPAPIALDLRLVSQLCCPQFFPDHAGIFNDLRTWLDLAYPKYLRAVVVEQILERNPDQKFAAKAQEFLESGDWKSMEPKLYQVQVLASRFDIHSAATGAVLTPAELRKIDSISIQVMLESASGSSEYVLRQKDQPDVFAKSEVKNTHFIPFEPTENETIQVTLDANLYARVGSQTAPISLPDYTRRRPVDTHFHVNPPSDDGTAMQRQVEEWASAILNANPGARSLVSEELSRERRYEFSRNVALETVQNVRHVIGPYALRDVLSPCYVVVTTQYRLTEVPATNSLWANMTAQSRNAIKSSDGRFGAFLAGPKTIPFDFMVNRSSSNFKQPPSAPKALLEKAGDGS